jgi:hypothetical protein
LFFSDTIIEAAWKHSLGVHALVWFGFDGGNIWKDRYNALMTSLMTNPKAKFVTRAIQFGSEPLFDSVLSVADMTTQVELIKKNVSSFSQIQVTISEMAVSTSSSLVMQNY